MGSVSHHKVRNKNEDENNDADVKDSEPKSSPASVSQPSSPPGFYADKPFFSQIRIPK